MERIAIISDIHANITALDAVLKDIRNRNIKRIFCLGDLVTKSVNPDLVIDKVRNNCEVVIKGNCDDATSKADLTLPKFWTARKIEYINDVIKGIETNKKEILALIEKNLKTDWKVERISKVDLSLLKLAIYEIKYKNLAFKIVINEVVELAKKYGEDQSKNFVNGILASIVKEDNKQN